jgi:tetratricopeptide (TPR) repeat protein
MTSEPGTYHQFFGTAHNVVQAGAIHGDVHFGPGCQDPIVVPRQLPPDVTHFTGRAGELDWLDGLLAEARRRPAMLVTAITGTAGAGKTALAVHWARQAQDHFADGTLYTDLCGYAPAPQLSPEQVLDGFLRALNIPATAIPAGLEAQTALYRSLLEGKHVLIVLDNASTPGRIRPLLPGSPGCAVVVTSRSRLSELVARDGARRLGIQPLPPSEAVTLLGQIAGTERIAADPGAAAEVVRKCACLPLAVRIAAERAAAHPHLQLADLAYELHGEQNRLDTLATGDDEDTAIRAVLSWSYRALTPPTARLFRLLGLHPGPDISIPAAAALSALTVGKTRRLLDELASGHLLEELARNRYRLHDLLRDYAAERARTEEPGQDQDRAMGRMLSWYLHTADAADHQVTPRSYHVRLDPPGTDCQPLSFTSRGQALEWCQAEQRNLLAAARQASNAGQLTIAWQIPVTLWDYFFLRKPWADWIAILTTALAAARQARDRYGEAWTRHNLGEAYFLHGQPHQARSHVAMARAIFCEIGDHWGETEALSNHGYLHLTLGEIHQALDDLHQALTMWRSASSSWGEAWTLHSLGEAYLKLQQPSDAINCLDQALATFNTIGDQHGRGYALRTLGLSHAQNGQPSQAIHQFRLALDVHDETGDTWGRARTLRELGTVQHQTGQTGAARQSWQLALAIFDELGDPERTEAHACLEALDSPKHTSRQ